jgi:hypothetical protein
MIQNIDDQGLENAVPGAGGTHVFAMVAREKARAAEMQRHFAASGEPVETVWYRNGQQLRAQEGENKGRFEAVILFSDSKAKKAAGDGAEAEEEAEALRRWLGGTPLIEAA